jgi:phage terminase Nu1 subunit (DNA packaging protein)
MSAKVSVGAAERVRGLAVPQVEPYITRRELARLMGVSIGTIDSLTRGGMPSTTWGRRTRRYRASTAIAWAQAQERRAA